MKDIQKKNFTYLNNRRIFNGTAAIKLNTAYKEAQECSTPACNHSDFIDNTHLTYKYVLFTAILSKETDESINPLCLQKKSELPGAYDARTVCHKVINGIS